MWLWVFAGVVLAFGFVVFWGAPYVPSKKNDLAQALDELYPLSKRDLLVDVGSGDGVVLRAAAARGARAVGYELNPILVAISRWLSRGDVRVQAHVANFWQVQLPAETTVVYVFAVQRDIAKLAAKIGEEAGRLGKPLMVISYGCQLPGHTAVKKRGAHFLYKIEPLHAHRAHV